MLICLKKTITNLFTINHGSFVTWVSECWFSNHWKDDTLKLLWEVSCVETCNDPAYKETHTVIQTPMMILQDATASKYAKLRKPIMVSRRQSSFMCVIRMWNLSIWTMKTKSLCTAFWAFSYNIPRAQWTSTKCWVILCSWSLPLIRRPLNNERDQIDHEYTCSSFNQVHFFKEQLVSPILFS